MTQDTSRLTTLVAQIAPQRSTQYAALAKDLALQELLLSPLGKAVADPAFVKLAGQEYLQFDLATDLDAAVLHELGLLAMTSAFFRFHTWIGNAQGPFLQPIETNFQPTLTPELVVTRRYRGKTNELFTHFLCNVARYSCTLADKSWSALRVLDPLAGGGTTLFAALVFGADVAGIELNAEDVKSTVAFLRQYLQSERISCRVKEERFKRLGWRWVFTIGKARPQQCILVNGDAVQAKALLPGYKPHLIIADLPYGIQHQGQLRELLVAGLPVWASMLVPQGALTFAWDATRFPRAEMIALVENASPLTVLNDPPYDQLAHRVDRVIKERDILVARPS